MRLLCLAGLAAVMLGVAAASASAFPVNAAPAGATALAGPAGGVAFTFNAGAVNCTMSFNANVLGGPIGMGGLAGTVPGGAAGPCLPAAWTVGFAGLPWTIVPEALLPPSGVGLIGLRGYLGGVVVNVNTGLIPCTFTGRVPILVNQLGELRVEMPGPPPGHPRLTGAPVICGNGNFAAGTIFDLAPVQTFS